MRVARILFVTLFSLLIIQSVSVACGINSKKTKEEIESCLIKNKWFGYSESKNYSGNTRKSRTKTYEFKIEYDSKGRKAYRLKIYDGSDRKPIRVSWKLEEKGNGFRLILQQMAYELTIENFQVALVFDSSTLLLSENKGNLAQYYFNEAD